MHIMQAAENLFAVEPLASLAVLPAQAGISLHSAIFSSIDVNTPMRLSQFHINTYKESPSDAEVISQKLMLRTSMIRKLSGGIYTWAPLGLRVLRKVEGIVREEMNRAGALEVLMPAVQPKELWDETGRWEKFGPQLLKIKDRADREFCFGPISDEGRLLFPQQ